MHSLLGLSWPVARVSDSYPQVQVDERKEGTQQRTRARVPLAGLVDVDLAARVVEAERYWRNDRDRVLFVVDMCDRRVLRVDVIRESLIPDLQERRGDERR